MQNLDSTQFVLNEEINNDEASKIQLIREQNLKDIVASSLLRRYIRSHDALLLQKAIELNPHNLRVNILLGNSFANLGNIQKALFYYNKVLQTDPCNADAHYGTGDAYRKMAQYDKAIKHYYLKMKYEYKPSFEVRNNLAWMLATHTKAEYYNPEKAILLAQQACRLTQYKNPELLDTLAVAYAASGQIQPAIKTAERALELAHSSGQSELAKEIEENMRLFKKD